MYKIKDGMQAEYDNYVKVNDDPYSMAVVTFSRRWAELMETKLNGGGATVADIADATSHEADTEGITGFMYGCAVKELAYFWVHGEELRKWHNGEYGHGDSDGVVNPAVLTISE